MKHSDDRAVLFDKSWYKNSGRSFKGDPWEHFATTGWRVNRDPHPLFDVEYYLKQAPELIRGDENPVDHFIRTGADRGLRPHILFDTVFYVDRYGSALDQLNPLVHYLVGGAAMGFDPNDFFASSTYLESSPDVADGQFNPLVHYVAFGGKELKRRVHPLFDPYRYATRRGLPEGINPLSDFVERLDALRAIPAVTHERPDVSAIILNLNKSVLTLECVADLLESSGPFTCEVIVVDNGSKPEEFALLTRHLPHCVKTVRLGTNRYFGEGNNLGVEASSGRNLLFLNNDAFVSPTTVAALLRVLAEHADAGAVGPKFVYADGRLQECGARVSSCGTVLQRGKHLDDRPGLFNRTEPVDYVSAACVLVPRALFDDVGGFDLTWDPAYYEDVDICLKLALLGKSTYYCPDAVVTHIENATSGDLSNGLRLNTVVEINREKFIARWGDYIEKNHDPAAARVVPPRPVEAGPSRAIRTALLYTPYPLIPGGGERYLLSIAQELSRTHNTYLATPERYSTYRLRTIAAELDLDLSRVRLLPLSAMAGFGECDLFISMGNEGLPPHPPIGRHRVFICQFPFPMHANHIAAAWGWLDGYDQVLVYSEFVASHFEARAKGLARRLPPVTVLPPPCPMYTDIGAGVRVPGRIINVGRFALVGHCKRQDTLVDAFRNLVAQSGRADLELHLVGTVSADPAARDYYLDVRRRAGGLPIFFHLSAPPETVRELYATSSLYWHATGFGQNEVFFPERMEHFGISVIEAMSSGTIPLVYGMGGPVEVVRDGVTGYQFRTIAELVEKSLAALAMPAPESELMRVRGVATARQFDAASFAERLRHVVADRPLAVEARVNGSAGRAQPPTFFHGTSEGGAAEFGSILQERVLEPARDRRREDQQTDHG